MATTNGTTKRARPSATRNSRASEKREAERLHYLKQVADNEARLASGLTANDEQMTTEQIETLRRVTEMQRARLAELMNNGK